MAHIPQDASYVNPPSEREVDEDAVTAEAVRLLNKWGCCLKCKWGALITDDEWEAGKRPHAETCDKLRERAIDALYGEDA